MLRVNRSEKRNEKKERWRWRYIITYLHSTWARWSVCRMTRQENAFVKYDWFLSWGFLFFTWKKKYKRKIYSSRYYCLFLFFVVVVVFFCLLSLLFSLEPRREVKVPLQVYIVWQIYYPSNQFECTNGTFALCKYARPPVGVMKRNKRDKNAKVKRKWRLEVRK